MKLFSYEYINQRWIAISLILLCSIASSFNSLAQVEYLAKEGKVTGLTGATASTFDLEDANQSEATVGKDDYFYVELNSPISLSATEGLVVAFGRWNNEGSPEATQVEGSADNSSWDVLGYSYMQFRGGQGTIEYSKRIYANEASQGKQYQYLRFKVLRTALGYADGDNVRFNKFNVFLLKDGELYPDGRIDPWRLNTDYYTSYKDFRFEPTRGILDPRNHYGKNKDYPTETPWGENNTFMYQGHTYELPTFQMQGDNQMPHVTEHTVYAMPGDIIPLLPYYDMPRVSDYSEVFAHWYKYNMSVDGIPQAQDYSHVTDEATGERLLDFLIDPAGIELTDNIGFMGGVALPRQSGQMYVIRTPDDFNEFANLVNNGQKDLKAILAADIDFEGQNVEMIGNGYCATFNGNGHTLRNLTINGTGNSPVGLFSDVAVGAAIKNLCLENCNVTNENGNAGILIGEIKEADWGSNQQVLVNNVIISGNITVNNSNSHGGSLVGNIGSNASLEIRNCGFVGTVTGNATSAALVGYLNQYSSSQVYLGNCYAIATIENYYSDPWNNYYGSAVYANNEHQTINNCIFKIKTTSGDSAPQTGADNCGIVAKVETGEQPEWPNRPKIYISKKNWKDFVMITDQWGAEKKIFEWKDWKDDNGNEYVYFVPEMNNYWYAYKIFAYDGEEDLTAENFDPEMDGLELIYSVGSNQEHNKDEYITITIVDFDETIAGNSVFASWAKDSDNHPIPPMSHVPDEDLQTSLSTGKKYLSNPDEDLQNKLHRWYGTVATFFKPLDTSKSPDAEENLKLGAHSFDIAADFSHEFDPSSDHNLDEEGKTIYSPIINFRHIFHVVSGKDFADDNTGSAEANRKYILGKRRIVSARAGVDFQVRLPAEFPVPFGQNLYSTTNFYYKSDENRYDRARGFGIEVIKDGNEIDNSDIFFFEQNPQSERGPNSSQGKRKYQENGPTYYTAGGDDLISRMLQCNAWNAQEGTYIVRIYALDDSNNPVYVWNDRSSKIYMMEYEITFLNGDDASLTNEKSIPDYHKDTYLQQEDVCGEPVVFLNFDEYQVFENEALYNDEDYFLHNASEDKSLKSFKWPTMWSQCSYSFGYAGFLDYNYNEYMIANHASQVLWGAGAKGYSGNPDGTSGLYDRLYYDTGGKEKGYFYYVNAASDPGVTSRLRIDRLCLGSTVIVTSWVSEFSSNPEVANVAFNFSAVLKDESRIRLHTFVTGYVNEKPDWQHVYYSFVPVLPETVKPSDIDHYELEVENNCKSSNGADYAVDDIRAYIVTPEITATQTAPVCGPDQTTTGIRLRTRYDKLLNSQGIAVADKVEDASDCTLYIAIFDKDKYDMAYSDPDKTIDQALAESLIKQSDDDGNIHDWIGMPLSSFFGNLGTYDPADENISYYTTYGSTSQRGVEYLMAHIRPYDEDIHSGKQYYISTYLVDGAISNQKEPGLIDMTVSEDACAKYGIVTLKGSGLVKVDGLAYNSEGTIEVCVGQAPVVQVEANNETTDLTVNFTADMIKETDGEGSAPLRIRKDKVENSALRITALINDLPMSSTVINISSDASPNYVENEDAALLIDPSLEFSSAIFSVASGKALSINTLDQILDTEIGVMADTETTTELLFEGIDGMEDIKLLDTETKEFLTVYEGMTYTVKGTASKRLYLVKSIADHFGADLTMVLNGRTVNAISSAEGISARVYDSMGVCVGTWDSDSNNLTFELGSGISIVEVRSNGEKLTRKYIVK